MKIISLPQNYKQIIKNTSIFMMTMGIISQLFYLYTLLNAQQINKTIEIIIWLAGFAIFVHLTEGLLAFFWALSHGKNPIRYAVYVFFTGTIGLLELFE